MSHIESIITTHPIELNHWLSRQVDPVCGAQVIFTGIVRNLNHGKKVVKVEYDAFEPLAKQTFQQIANEAFAKWGPNLAITIIHRVGELLVGELSILIVVNSKHRDEAYLTSRYLLEEIKTRAPIWKKDFIVTGKQIGRASCRERVYVLV